MSTLPDYQATPFPSDALEDSVELSNNNIPRCFSPFSRIRMWFQPQLSTVESKDRPLSKGRSRVRYRGTA